MAEDTALEGPSNLPQKPADSNYLSKLEEKLKEKRKMQEQTKLKDLSILNPNLKSDDSTNSWKSFAGSTKNIKQDIFQNVTKFKSTISTSMIPFPSPIPTKSPVTILTSAETFAESSGNDQGG